MWDRNLLPNPSPLDAPFTRPAISTNEIVVFIVFFDFEISDNLLRFSVGIEDFEDLMLDLDNALTKNGK